ncbi:secreted phosphoprotein 24 isoform X1 [Sebastes fasciatus]|uniref:secreted phosphoprotein 24 isoform X1 n=1 Tax=Sebastes fasciatus TaxID=394691 RepID=UPI003D9DEE0E
MKIYVLLLTLALGCSGVPLYNSELESMADRGLGAALAEVNSAYAVGHLYRVTRGSVSRVIPVGLNTVDLLMVFGIKETECVKTSRSNPQTCAFRPGFFVILGRTHVDRLMQPTVYIGMNLPGHHPSPAPVGFGCRPPPPRWCLSDAAATPRAPAPPARRCFQEGDTSSTSHLQTEHRLLLQLIHLLLLHPSSLVSSSKARRQRSRTEATLSTTTWCESSAFSCCLEDKLELKKTAFAHHDFCPFLCYLIDSSLFGFRVQSP